MKKKLHIGLLEIGIFGSSLVMMGLIFWFLSLTMFGSSKNSEARLLTSFGAPGAPSQAAVAFKAAEIPAAPAVEQSAPVTEPSVPETPAPVPVPEPAQVEQVQASAPVPVQEEIPAQTNFIPAPPSAIEPKADVPVENKAEELPLAAAKPAPVKIAYNASRDPMMRPEEQSQMERAKKEREESSKQVTRAPKASSVDTVKRKLSVQGVMDTPEGIVAIINNEIYKRGDVVGGAKILRILGNRVQFKYRENIFEKSVQE